MQRGLFIFGEIRGVSRKPSNGSNQDKYAVHVETNDFETIAVSLFPELINSGFHTQIESMIGKTVSFQVRVNPFNGRIYYQYADKNLPVLVEPLKAKPLVSSKS